MSYYSSANHTLKVDHVKCIMCIKGQLAVRVRAAGDRRWRLVSRSSLDDRTGTLSSVEPVHSGLYAYHVATSTWSLLRSDAYHPGPGQIRSRVSHCMLLDHVRHRTSRCCRVDCGWVCGGVLGRFSRWSARLLNVSMFELVLGAACVIQLEDLQCELFVPT